MMTTRKMKMIPRMTTSYKRSQNEDNTNNADNTKNEDKTKKENYLTRKMNTKKKTTSKIKIPPQKVKTMMLDVNLIKR